MKDRKQQVIERNKYRVIQKSDMLYVQGGVPQGSILGPILYRLYTNDLPNSINRNITQFADDTTVALCENSEITLNSELFKTLNTLENWFHSNNLTMNINKTNLIILNYQLNKEC